MAEGGNAATHQPATCATEVPAEVRVVRCPKCTKLLPELAGVKAYRCGGCNAALQAPMVGSRSVEKTDDGQINATEVPDALSSPQENAQILTNQESTRVELGGHVSGNSGCDGDSSVNSVSRIYSNVLRISKGEYILNHCFSSDDARHHHGSAQQHHPSKDHVNGPYLNMDENTVADTEGTRVSKMLGNSTHVDQKFYQSSVQKCRECHRASGSWRAISGSPTQGMCFSPSPGDGPIYEQSSNRHHHVNYAKYGNPEFPNRVEHLEQDRAELLKKLDELRDQLSRSCEITNGQTGKVPVDTRTVPTDPYEHHGLYNCFHVDPESYQGPSVFKGLSSSNGPSVQQFPVVGGDDLNVQHYHSLLQNQDDIYAHREPFGLLPLRRAPCHLPHQFPERLSNSNGCGHYDPDAIVSYPCDAFDNQTMHSNIFNMPPRIPSTVLGNRRNPYLTNCHECYPIDEPPVICAENFNRNTASFLCTQPPVQKRPILKQQNGHRCHPLGSGAPFIVCSSCFQLIQVPRRLLMRDKEQHKLRCGSCSHIISFEVKGNHIILSDPAKKINPVPETINCGSDGVEDILRQRVFRDEGHRVCPEDFIDPICSTHFADEKFVLSDPSLNVTRNEMIERKCSSTSSGSENREGLGLHLPESKDGSGPLFCPKEMNGSAELPQRSDICQRDGSVPLRDHFGCSSFNNCGSRSETGSRSTRSEQDKLISLNGNFKQNSVKDVLMATEMEFTADEYPNPAMSQDSTEACEDELPRASKGGESFLTGLIKKGFSRSNPSLENGKVKVSINSHRISDRLVKKAEKLAGPIRPGDYWYDYQAGFWGVMGQPCLGIIPPFIEEFNYPMPKNCSGGNTGVVVNGRELHYKDLQLLSGRGLPTSRDSSYIIEISGRVLDAVTGEELNCLGKLAPTVEKVKHGFGMRIPGVVDA